MPRENYNARRDRRMIQGSGTAARYIATAAISSEYCHVTIDNEIDGLVRIMLAALGFQPDAVAAIENPLGADINLSKAGITLFRDGATGAVSPDSVIWSANNEIVMSFESGGGIPDMSTLTIMPGAIADVTGDKTTFGGCILTTQKAPINMYELLIIRGHWCENIEVSHYGGTDDYGIALWFRDTQTGALTTTLAYFGDQIDDIVVNPAQIETNSSQHPESAYYNSTTGELLMTWPGAGGIIGTQIINVDQDLFTTIGGMPCVVMLTGQWSLS